MVESYVSCVRSAFGVDRRIDMRRRFSHAIPAVAPRLLDVRRSNVPGVPFAALTAPLANGCRRVATPNRNAMECDSLGCKSQVHERIHDLKVAKRRQECPNGRIFNKIHYNFSLPHDPNRTQKPSTPHHAVSARLRLLAWKVRQAIVGQRFPGHGSKR